MSIENNVGGIIRQVNLNIDVHKKGVNGGFYTMLIITSFFIVAPILITVFDKWAPGSVGGLIVGFPIFGYIYAFLVAFTFKLYKLKNFIGPIMTLTSDGIIDHFNDGEKLLWQDIKVIKIIDAGISQKLIITPIKLHFRQKLLCILGIKPLEYMAQYLGTSIVEIAQYMLDHAPEEILE